MTDVPETNRIPLDRPVIVEGKYDKNKLSSVIDAPIFTTSGFGLFKDHELAALLRRIGRESGVFVLTDSDGAGKVIRAKISSLLPKEQITHLYIPQIPGKERRKRTPSRAGTLGVEGMDPALLRDLFAPFAADAPSCRTCEPALTKADFFADGLSGCAGAAQKREALARALQLPTDLTPNALLCAVNLLCTREHYRALVDSAAEPPSGKE